MKKRLLALLVAAVMTVLTGCMSCQIDLELQPDGSGTMTAATYMADEFFTAMETTPEIAFAEAIAGGGTLVTKTIQGVPYSGVTQTLPFASVTELKPSQAESSQEPVTLWATVQNLNGERLVTLHSRVPSDSELTGGAAAPDPGTDASGQALAQALLTMELRATFPAGVKSVTGLEETAYTIQGNTVTIDLVSTEQAAQFTVTGSLGQTEVLPGLDRLTASAAYDGRFIDVPSDQWYTSAVIYCFEHGIINGMTPNTFVPDGQLTLAQVLKMAAVVHAAYQGSTDPGLFAPIQGQPWYQPYLDYALVAGLAEPTLTDAPDRPATRAEMASIIAHCLPAAELGSTAAPVDFVDVNETTPYADSIALLQSAGIVGGITSDSFGPDQPLTRAQAAVFFHRLISPADRISG